MFALPLTDPLWRKLDDAHRDRDIPGLLASLAAEWNTEEASSLFWDCLCHQDTCYGATYAAVPHLLRIAEAPPTPEAVGEIAQFLGHVALVAYRAGGCCGEDDGSIPQGLPLDLESWDRKLDPYRSLARHARNELADPDYPEAIINSLQRPVSGAFTGSTEAVRAFLPEGLVPDPTFGLSREARQAELDRYEDLLSRPPVDTADLAMIARIRDAFLGAQQAIAALCTRAYESAEDDESRSYHLAGIAAALGDRALAKMLEHGEEGNFACATCGWSYNYILYGDRIACYAIPAAPGELGYTLSADDPGLLDHREGAPNRASGFVVPCKSFEPGSPAERLAELAAAHGDPDNETLLHLFKSSYACGKCGSETPLGETRD